MNLEEHNLIKSAYVALDSLKRLTDELEQEKQMIEKQAAFEKQAVDLALLAFKQGQISAEMISSKINEFKSNTAEELEIVKKAYELGNNTNVSMFKLGSADDSAGLTAEAQFEYALLNN